MKRSVKGRGATEGPAMIDLHQRLSEFSYGYGVTSEVQNLLESVGLRATPFLPNLIHEAELGFDVAFETRGTAVILQFKLGEELRRFRRSKGATLIPYLLRPFWRFSVNINGHQFLRLREFEDAGCDVFYAAPQFSSWFAYQRSFQDRTVLENSLLVTPQGIYDGAVASGSTADVHRVVYDRFHRYVCSEPVGIPEVTFEKLGHNIRERVLEGQGILSDRIKNLYERERPDTVPGTISGRHRRDIFERAKRPVDAMAAIVGLEAWSQGAELIFVTEVEE